MPLGSIQHPLPSSSPILHTQAGGEAGKLRTPGRGPEGVRTFTSSVKARAQPSPASPLSLYLSPTLPTMKWRGFITMLEFETLVAPKVHNSRIFHRWSPVEGSEVTGQAPEWDIGTGPSLYFRRCQEVDSPFLSCASTMMSCKQAQSNHVKRA